MLTLREPLVKLTDEELMDERFDRADQKFEDWRSWADLFLGRFQTRAGKRLEDVVAGALRLALKRPDIRPEHIRLRQKFVDEQGLVGPPGRRRFEIDTLAQDGRLMVFEVKSVCKPDDVDYLADKVTIIRAMNPGQEVEGVMVAMGAREGVQARCAELGITLVSSYIEERDQ